MLFHGRPLFRKYWGAMLPSTLGMRLDYFSVGTAICFALDVAAVGIGPFGYIIQIVFVDFRDAAGRRGGQVLTWDKIIISKCF